MQYVVYFGDPQFEGMIQHTQSQPMPKTGFPIPSKVSQDYTANMRQPAARDTIVFISVAPSFGIGTARLSLAAGC